MALDNFRTATAGVASAADSLIAAGDLSKSELRRAFNLSRAEHALITPARHESPAVVDPVPDGIDTSATEVEQHKNQTDQEN